MNYSQEIVDPSPEATIGMKRNQLFFFWLLLGLTGQAAALQMIDAGNRIHYQHYKPAAEILSKPHLIILIFFVLQVSCVLITLIRYRRGIGNWMRQNFRTWQLLMIAVVFSLSSATVSAHPGSYGLELVFATFVQFINLGNVVLIALTIPERILDRVGRLWKIVTAEVETEQEKFAFIDRFALIAALWVFTASLVLNVFSYQRHPHIKDEVAYLYQARFFAAGAIALPAPPVPEAFEFHLMDIKDGKWFSTPPPGWGVILALGILLKIPSFINPFLCGLNLLLIYILLCELYDRRISRIAILLFCFSPWYIFMGMNYMTHMFTLTCALVATVALIQARKNENAKWGWFAGFAVGLESLIRPLDGLILAVLLGLWSIGFGGKRLKLSAILAFISGTILVGSFIFPYNRYLTGDPTKYAINVYDDRIYGKNSNAYGFGPDRGMGWPMDPFPGHGPLDALVNANLNTFSLNIELFGWSIGSLILAAYFLLCGKLRRSDYLMIGVITVIFIAYFFYYFSGGPDFGARYWFIMILPLVVFTARGMENLRENADHSIDESRGRRIAAAVMVLCFFSLMNYFPWRAIDKYHHYLGMRPDIRYLDKQLNFGRSLILIRGPLFPDYASAAVYNPLDLDANVPVYAWDQTPEIQTELLQHYRDRAVWIIDGPTLTHDGYIVKTGPVSANRIMESVK